MPHCKRAPFDSKMSPLSGLTERVDADFNDKITLTNLNEYEEYVSTAPSLVDRIFVPRFNDNFISDKNVMQKYVLASA